MKKIGHILFFVFVISFYSKGTILYPDSVDGSWVTETNIETLLDAACSGGDCTGDTDTLWLVISGSDVKVSGNWDLRGYHSVVIEILDDAALIVPKFSEIILSENGGVIISSSNTGGLVAGNTGNSYLSIGDADFHGNGASSFTQIIANGGASGGGFGNVFQLEFAVSDPSSLSFCQGDVFDLSYTVTLGKGRTGNIFQAQLSDESGSFTSAVSIGSLTATTSGTISCSLPSPLTAGVSYRVRVVSSSPVASDTNSSAITIASPTADPSLYGDNEWDVFYYDGVNFGVHHGSYTVSGLDINSASSWGSATSPVNAVGYQGCTSSDFNYFSYEYKRKGFPCGDYTLNVPNHNDSVFLLIDGSSVFSKNLDFAAHSNVWNGFLGPHSEIDFQIWEYTGTSYGELTFTNFTAGGKITGEYVWVGSMDTDWTNDANWCPSAPAAGDDVIILSGMDFSPTISSSGIVFNNITIEAGASLTLTAGASIEVKGNWIDEGATITNNGTITFSGTSSQSISANNAVFNNVVINGSGIVLNGGLQVGGLLTLTNGVITTTSSNILTITANGSLTGGSSSSYIDGPLDKSGTGDFMFPIGKSGFYSPLGISNISSSSTFRAEYFRSVYADTANKTGINNVSGVEYWDLDRTAGTGSVSIELAWSGAVSSGVDNFGDLVIAHYTGGQWVSAGQVSNSGSAESGPGSITSGLVSSFSPFTLGSLGALNNPLPVELLYFSGIEVENIVQLNWATAMEKDNDYFILERSTDGYVFDQLDIISGAGNSSETIEYAFFDNSPVFDNEVIYYRLTQIDYNGEREVFDIIAVDTKEEALLGDLDIYPNPNSGVFKLFMSSVDNEDINYTISSIHGGSTLLNGVVKEGDDIDVSALADGVYKIIVRTQGNVITRKLIKE